jgi:hypothetical protein
MATFHSTVFEAIEDFIFSQRDDAPTLDQETPPPIVEPAALEPAGTMTAPLGAPPLVPLMDRVNVEAILDYANAMEGRDLSWRTSIADLLSLCGVDPSQENREALASELGMANNASDATLLRATMHGLDERGGDIPADFK